MIKNTCLTGGSASGPVTGLVGVVDAGVVVAGVVGAAVVVAAAGDPDGTLAASVGAAATGAAALCPKPGGRLIEIDGELASVTIPAPETSPMITPMPSIPMTAIA